MRKTLQLALLSLGMLVAGTVSAQYTQTLPEYSGPVVNSAPFSTFTVGTFTGLPTSGITFASISGTFGNTGNPSSGGVDLFLDGVFLAQCTPILPCYSSNSPLSWTYTFTAAQYGIFADGQGVFTAQQTAPTIIRLGPTTLTVQTTSLVPEPSTYALMMSGLLAVGFAARKRRTR